MLKTRPRGAPVTTSAAIRAGAMVAVCLVAAAMAVGAAPVPAPATDPPKIPLTMEMVPGAIVLDRADPAEVFVLIGNTGTTPLRSFSLRLHVPADVTHVEERWNGGTARRAGSMAYAVPDVAPLEHRVVKVTLVYGGAWTALKSSAFVVEAAYTWESSPSTGAIPGEALRPLAVKIGALEGLSVLGVPLALAIFVVPGLLALSLFAAPLREPIKWVDENKLFVSFLASGLLILLWNRFLRTWLKGPDLWSGVSIELLLAFSVVAGFLGGVAGIVVRTFQRTQAERWPVTRAQPLLTLLANLAERGMLPASPSAVHLASGLVFSAVAADTDTPGEVVLLPRRYRIKTSDPRLRRQFAGAVAAGAPGAGLARLLRRNPAVVTVADGIKQQNSVGQLMPIPGGDEPMWTPREGIARTVAEGDSLWLL